MFTVVDTVMWTNTCNHGNSNVSSISDHVTKIFLKLKGFCQMSELITGGLGVSVVAMDPWTDGSRWLVIMKWGCRYVWRLGLVVMVRVCYLAQLDALRCVTFRPSGTIQGGRSLPAHILPAEETEHRTK